MRDFLFGWLTKPKIELTILNEIGCLVFLALAIFIFITILYLVVTISDYIKDRRNKKK